MKRFLFILACLALVLSSCSLNSVDNYTPKLSFTTFSRHFYALDSAATNMSTPRFSEELNAYCMDTIELLDTVCFQVALQGIANNIQSFVANRAIKISLIRQHNSPTNHTRDATRNSFVVKRHL